MMTGAGVSLANAPYSCRMNRVHSLRIDVTQALYAIDLRAIWRFLKGESVSFWLINAYLLLEYVRPQSIYSAIAGPPWSRMTILGALAAVLFEGKFTRRATVADVA